MFLSTQKISHDPKLAAIARPRTRVAGRQRILEVEHARDRMVHHELMIDAAGETIYDQAVPMDYVVGSGRRARAYLYQRGPLLFMSPLNWYATTHRWDLAPGYQPDDLRRKTGEAVIAIHGLMVESDTNRHSSQVRQTMSLDVETLVDWC